MKEFQISDLLTVTTGRLVSNRHMEGVYEILNFLTGDNLYTHQLPRAMRECEPWLRTQFPQLMPDSPEMQGWISTLDERLKGANQQTLSGLIATWVEEVRRHFKLPERLTVYEMDRFLHTRIDPVEEAQAMMGNQKVIVVKP